MHHRTNLDLTKFNEGPNIRSCAFTHTITAGQNESELLRP